MEGDLLAVLVTLSGALVLWSLVSARLERWNISAPIAFVVVGFVATNHHLGDIHLSVTSSAVRHIAELTLAVVLFADASTIDLQKLRRDAALPSRLLGIGLPLTIALGTVVAHWLIPGTSWWVAAVIGTAVAPTDAALGAAIIEDERVPMRVRRVLNVESGLNDGIATPFVNLFLVAAVAGTALEVESDAHAVVELVVGVAVGVLLGAVGAWLMAEAQRRSLSAPNYRAAGVAALALLSYAGALSVNGNGFVAAFVGGLAFGAVSARRRSTPEMAFTDELDKVLSLVVWFIFGALMLPVLQKATGRDVAFALLALTVVRMAPVALSLVGGGLDRSTILVIGWFGPRGLASVVFALLALDTLAPAEGSRTLTVIATTVLLSVVLHGATAAPVARRYGSSHRAAEGDEPAMSST